MRQLRERLGWKIGILLSVILLLVMASLSVGDYLWQRNVFLDNLNDHIAEESWTVAVLLQDSVDPAERQRLLTKLAEVLDRDEQGGWDHEIFILDDRANVRQASLEKFLGQPMDSEPVLRMISGEATFASGVMRHGDHAS